MVALKTTTCDVLLIIFMSWYVATAGGHEIVTNIYFEEMTNLPLAKLTKCSDNVFEADTLYLPRSWVGSLNASNEAPGNNSFVRVNNVASAMDCRENQSRLIDLPFNTSTSTEYFTHNGYFFNGSMYYPPGTHCVASVTEYGLKVKICIPNCQQDLCLPKCCPPGKVLAHNLETEYFNPFTAECKAVENVWSPFLYRISNGTPDVREKSLRSDLPFYSIPRITDVWTIDGYTPLPKATRQASADIVVLDNSTIYIRSRPKPQKGWQTISPISCIDGMWETSSSRVFVPNEMNQVVWSIEIKKMLSAADTVRNMVSLVIWFMTFTGFCNLVTALAYLLVWNKLNIHGWTITMFSFSGLLNIVFFEVIFGILLYNRNFINSLGCKIIGATFHLANLSIFTWMNVLTFDMWTTISSMTALSQRAKGRRRFAGYCCYGFGIPAIIVAISVYIDVTVPPNNFAITRPEYGFQVCGVSVDSTVYYETFPRIVFFAINIVLQSLFFKSFCHMRKGSKLAGMSSTKQNKSMATLQVKLTIIMGSPYFLYFIALLFKNPVVKFWLHIIATFVVIFRGVALSWVFLSDSKIKRHLREKFSQLFNHLKSNVSKTSTVQAGISS